MRILKDIALGLFAVTVVMVTVPALVVGSDSECAPAAANNADSSTTAAAYRCDELPALIGLEPAGKRRIALSFDDAPKGDGPVLSGDERAIRLIEVLRSHDDVQAVFFVTPGDFERPGGEERITQYAAAGHLIANHSNSHQWLSRTDTAEYIADIRRAEAWLAGFDNRRPWFRFPYLDEGTPREKRDEVRAALAADGLINGYVTVDNYDWYLDAKWKAAVKEGRSVNIEALRQVYVDMLTEAASFYDRVATESLGRSPVHVLLLHENDVAAMFVGDLITALRAAGWSIVSPDLAYADAIAKIVPETLMTRQGHVAALAVEAGVDNRNLDHWAIDEHEIDALLDARQVFGKP